MQVNEEDHTRLISMEMGADIKAVFERFASAVEKCEKSIQKEGYDWMHNDHLGSPPRFGMLSVRISAIECFRAKARNELHFSRTGVVVLTDFYSVRCVHRR